MMATNEDNDSMVRLVSYGLILLVCIYYVYRVVNAVNAGELPVPLWAITVVAVLSFITGFFEWRYTRIPIFIWISIGVVGIILYFSGMLLGHFAVASLGLQFIAPGIGFAILFYSAVYGSRII